MEFTDGIMDLIIRATLGKIKNMESEKLVTKMVKQPYSNGMKALVSEN